MLKSLEINSFKRFSTASLKCENLTVLTGANGAGKSSAIHALLLLRKAARSKTTSIELNDNNGLQLGAGIEVLNSKAEDNIIRLSIKEEKDFNWSLLVTENEFDLVLEKLETPEDYTGVLAVNDSNFTYLCAERVGPRDTLNASPASPSSLNIGSRGEYSAQILSLNSNQRVHENLLFASGENSAPLLQQQTEAWLSEIVRPLQVEASWLPGSLTTKLRFKSLDSTALWTRPSNMGFGVSYALPILIAGLRAQKGDLLIVENPEAHLHPAGQSKIGDFLARVSSTGCQVFIETHSDHVINGIRKSIASGTAKLAPSDASINYFTDEAKVIQISIEKNGRLSKWPKGFFDQSQVDLAQLTRFQRE